MEFKVLNVKFILVVYLSYYLPAWAAEGAVLAAPGDPGRVVTSAPRPLRVHREGCMVALSVPGSPHHVEQLQLGRRQLALATGLENQIRIFVVAKIFIWMYLLALSWALVSS